MFVLFLQIGTSETDGMKILKKQTWTLSLKSLWTHYLIIVVEMTVEWGRRLGGVESSFASLAPPSSHTAYLICSFTYSFKQFLGFCFFWLLFCVKTRVFFFIFLVKYLIVFFNIYFTFWVHLISEIAFIYIIFNNMFHFEETFLIKMIFGGIQMHCM